MIYKLNRSKPDGPPFWLVSVLESMRARKSRGSICAPGKGVNFALSAF